jgi:hypothetical protein
LAQITEKHKVAGEKADKTLLEAYDRTQHALSNTEPCCSELPAWRRRRLDFKRDFQCLQKDYAKKLVWTGLRMSAGAQDAWITHNAKENTAWQTTTNFPHKNGTF